MRGGTLSHFEILEPLGEGGMGVVYKARDLRLNRQVALKVLPPDKVADASRRARFIQEAQAASALNHPNIITIHEIGHDNNTDFIAMELVKGRTLDAVIGKRGLQLGELLKYAIQIADALAAAHAAGIVHRDLKPGNVMVTDTGMVKVLDFGLAKLTEQANAADNATRTLGFPSPKTELGAVIGTTAYMSPEQAEGRKVDVHSDIFSFGSVLYEMVTGRRAFAGDTAMSTISAILRDEPTPPSRLDRTVPRDLERIIARCLRKDPARRFQHMDDIKVALLELKEESDSGLLVPGAAAGGKALRRWSVAAAVLAVLAVASGAWMWFRSDGSRRQGPPEMRRLTIGRGSHLSPAISRDGKFVAYSSDRAGDSGDDLWLQQVAGGDPVRLTRLPGDEGAAEFSPEGSRILFCGHGPSEGLYVIPTLGGEPRKIMDNGHDARFSPDGKSIVFRRDEGVRGVLYVMPASGGNPQPLTAGMFTASSAVWSPDGAWILFRGGLEDKGPFVNRYDWWLVNPEAGQPRRVRVLEALRRLKVIGENAPAPSPAGWYDGRIAFSAGRSDEGRSLWELGINPQRAEIAGQPRRITFGAGAHTTPAVSSGGDIAFASSETITDYWGVDVNPATGQAKGEPRQLTRNSGAVSGFHYTTPDGNLLLYPARRSDNLDVYLLDTTTGKEAPIIAGPTNETPYGLSADGRTLLWLLYDASGRFSSVLSDASGGNRQKVCDDCRCFLSADGNVAVCAAAAKPEDSIVYYRTSGKVVSIPQSRQADRLIRTQPALSPSGRHVLVLSAVEGTHRSRLFVVPFDLESRQLGESIPVSDDASTIWHMAWAPDGKFFYFLSNRDGNGCLWGQRMDPRSARPRGEAFPVRHFHGRTGDARPMFVAATRTSVIVSLSETSSSIWLTKMPE